MDITTIIKEYIEELINNQNNTNDEVLKNQTTTKEYLELIKPAIELIYKDPNISFVDLKNTLIEESGIKATIKDIIHNKGLTPGLVLNFGTMETRDEFVYGLKQEWEILNNNKVFNPLEMKSNTIFDLASTSKIFTSLAILKLMEDNLLDLSDPITKYAPNFKNLENVTIYDLLKFKINIKTKVRVDVANSKEEAERILFTAAVIKDKEIYNNYTDIGSMILRYVVENITQMPFSKYIDETILKPLDMTDTYLNTPIEKIEQVASENFSVVIDTLGNPFIRTNNIPGTPHDSKAIAIGHHDGIAPGHAGYFSCTKDMVILANALAKYKILNKDTVLSMSDNIVGTKLPNDDYSWYYGSLVYVKQPTLGKYSVYNKLSGKAFMSPGFAGTVLYVDPLNKITLFLGSNRLHNRIYKIHSSQLDKIHVNTETGQKSFILPNGENIIVNEDFTKEREAIIQKALDLSLQIKFLEIIYNRQKKDVNLIRTIN